MLAIHPYPTRFRPIGTRIRGRIITGAVGTVIPAARCGAAGLVAANIGRVGRAGRLGGVIRIVFGLIVALLFPTSLCADEVDFDSAVRAAESGDYETALQMFQVMAANGDARGENGLGVLYLRGQGVERDIDRAAALFHSAAEKGLRTAQKNLGELHVEGVGVERDYLAAHRWFGLAASQGDPGAQLSLGMLYAQGMGVGRDYEQAMDWFRKSAEQGDAEAQANIGHLYRAGYGIERDYVLAYAWYGVSAANGFAMGPELRESVAEYLTPSQLERARGIAREIWLKLDLDE